MLVHSQTDIQDSNTYTEPLPLQLLVLSACERRQGNVGVPVGRSTIGAVEPRAEQERPASEVEGAR